MDELRTTLLQDWQRRMKDGDAAAREELVRAVMQRMERLARKMLKADWCERYRAASVR